MLIVRAFYKNLPTKYGNYNKSAGRSSQILRVYRGGSWYDLAKFGRLSYRSSFNSSSKSLAKSKRRLATLTSLTPLSKSKLK